MIFFFFPFLKVVAAWLICLRIPCFGFCRLLAYHVIIKRSLICYFLFPLNMHLTLLFWTEKENGPRTVKDVKLISAGKILENNRTLGECRSPLCDIPGGVTTMHVVVQPPSTEKGKISLFWKNRGNECCLIIQTHILLLLLSCCFGLGTLEPCTKLTEYYISRLMRFLSSLLHFFFILSFWGKKIAEKCVINISPLFHVWGFQTLYFKIFLFFKLHKISSLITSQVEKAPTTANHSDMIT